jgi:hypothetical protein
MLHRNELIIDAIKVSPPVAFLTTSMAGVDWPKVSYILASIYSALMICQHVWLKWIKPKLKK